MARLRRLKASLPSSATSAIFSAACGRGLERGRARRLARRRPLRASAAQPAAHGDDPQILEHGLADPSRRPPVAFGAERLGQDQVDPVAGEDQAGIAGGFVDRHRDRAHARLQHGGEKAALAGLDHAARGQRLADGERAPDDGAHELLSRRPGRGPDRSRARQRRASPASASNPAARRSRRRGRPPPPAPPCAAPAPGRRPPRGESRRSSQARTAKVAVPASSRATRGRSRRRMAGPSGCG